MRAPDFKQFNNDQSIGLSIQFYKVKRSDEGRTLYNSEGVVNTDYVDVLDVDSGALRTFIYRESTLSFGVKGQFTLDNTTNILETLELNSSAIYDLYARVFVIDEQAADIPSQSGLEALVYITETTNTTKNSVENVTTFFFEEAFVNSWRRLGIDTVISRIVETSDNVLFNVTEFIDRLNRPDLYFGYDSLTPDIIHEDSDTPNTYFDITTFVAHVGRSEKTVYSVIEEMMSQTLAGDTGGEAQGLGAGDRCPYLRTVATTDSRKILFAPYMTDRHQSFLSDVNDPTQVKTKRDYSDVYTEKFGAGQFAESVNKDINSSIHNAIESYNVSKASPQLLRDTVWGNYSQTGNTSPDPGRMFASTLKFSEIQSLYEQREFGGMDININVPLVDNQRLNTFNLTPRTSGTIDSTKQSIKQCNNEAYNACARSFLTVTEAVVFGCRGSLIRTPNKFVWLDLSAALFREQAIQDVDKIFYVTGVTHKFIGSVYKTDLQVSKLTGGFDVDTIDGQLN